MHECNAWTITRAQSFIIPTDISFQCVNQKRMYLISETQFWNLHLPISNGFDTSKIYGKLDDFDFDTVDIL